MRILYADDSNEQRKMLIMRLEKARHNVTVVTDGEELLEELDKQHFDLVITDNTMPIITGIEALRRIRADSRFERLPVIVYTNDKCDGLEREIESLDGIYADKAGDFLALANAIFAAAA